MIADALPHLDIAELGAWTTPADERSDEQKALAARSDELLAELRANDVLVLAVPMYNLGIPSQLKAWFDRVLRAGETFRYTENGPQGRQGKRVIILAARGGIYAGSDMDSQTPHLKSMLGLMGITDVDVVYAEGLNMGEEQRAAAQKKRFRQLISWWKRYKPSAEVITENSLWPVPSYWSRSIRLLIRFRWGESRRMGVSPL